ncbi:MAG: hypothetical protein JWR45_63 [Blastococcus sp.]|jgi:hypothetical protein|nr:hypothetical protein [Blastococcus sp.]
MSADPAPADPGTAPPVTHVDFDLHGIVGIRLVDAQPGDVATLTRQIGPLVGTLRREPDIIVRFVDDLPVPRRMTYAGWQDSAAANGDFYLLSGKDGVPARTLLPMEDVGGRCEIVCERRAGRVPHLLAVINMTALARGALPLHASAFTYRGEGFLATGWAKGGKTETLLAFAARGAQYVGDEWVYLTTEGDMYGVPEPIRLWHWHVEQLPALRAGLPAATRARLRGLPVAAHSAAALGRRLGGLPGSILRRAAPVVRRQAYVQVPPAQLFGEEAIALHGHLDHVVLVESHDRDEVTIQTVPGATVAARMAASLEEERAPFLEAYRQFRFLFPERSSPVVEQALSTERLLLERILGDRPAHLLRHPYPVLLESLVGPVESLLRTAAEEVPSGDG